MGVVRMAALFVGVPEVQCHAVQRWKRLERVLIILIVILALAFVFAAAKLWKRGARAMSTVETAELKPPESKPSVPKPRWGWAVKERCQQPLDVLVFVMSSADEWSHRAAMRGTLFEEAALRRFNNWAAVFFTTRGSDSDELRNAWLDLEAHATGDLVVLPNVDASAISAGKLVAGMQWVVDHCPDAALILKMDDFVLVEPFKDDVHFSGRLAALLRLGHVNTQAMFEWDPAKTSCIYKGSCTFAHNYNNWERTMGQRALWNLVLWHRRLYAGDKVELSARLDARDYRNMFEEIKNYLQRPYDEDDNTEKSAPSSDKRFAHSRL
ncbi:uncharacterized protein [Dermacentor albipictus]|uniref:uncharacterized protein isoform X3 n=1 Tax=Dermacentor albipictus TaxID=60249 RepID=UPI0031FE26DE